MKIPDTIGVTKPMLNFENFRHYKATLNYENIQHFSSHRSNAEIRKTSDTLGVTEAKLNYEKLQTL
jgi:hypothetical protein